MIYRGSREEYVGCCSRKEVNVMAWWKSEILTLNGTHKKVVFYDCIMKMLNIQC
jgi:hypothetical protein